MAFKKRKFEVIVMEINTEGKTAKEMYKLLTGSIAPRPIALVSTQDKDGVLNVAPFSFFTVVTSAPPTVMFSIGELNERKKDTLQNIEDNPEFVINIVNVDLGEAVNNAAANFKPDVSEFEEVNMTPVPAKTIDAYAVKESPIHLECVLDRIIKVGKGFMVLAQVKHFVIDDALYLGNYKIDFQKLNPIVRFAGSKYGEIGNIISLERIVNHDKTLQK
ncbi:flavin reductase family protein [Oceanobacillus longus]|uniref:Flavin reductase family protein n=1 Tax=Oceanobacillus longus TaxID=930120 RepID=A0ABV8H315_9BACI